MPPLGTNERDLVAEQLLTDWITQALPSRQSFAQWQTSQFGSTGAPEAQAAADPDADGSTNAFEFLAGTNPLAPADRWNWNALTLETGQLQIGFTQPANRAALVETSRDLVTWQLWDVPGNAPSFPATSQARVFFAPIGETPELFRVRLREP
jgi:hypothetical protein